MVARVHRLDVRGGIVLDLVLAAGIILVAAFLLELAGIGFAQLFAGAGRFFGL